MIEQGYEPSTEMISSELTQATSWDAKHLKVEKAIRFIQFGDVVVLMDDLFWLNI